MTTTPLTKTTKTTKGSNKSTTTYLKNGLNVVYVGICVFLLYKAGNTLYTNKVLNDTAKKETSCPTLLSISRSARDTLLVMKAETLCTQYVLDNIK